MFDELQEQVLVEKLGEVIAAGWQRIVPNQLQGWNDGLEHFDVDIEDEGLLEYEMSMDCVAIDG